MKRLTFLGFVCLAASLAAAAGPILPAANNNPSSATQAAPRLVADGILITGVTPASGNFPTSGPGVVIDFDWVLASAADGQIAAFFTSAPAPGPGQTGLPPTFGPVWLSKGKGHAKVSLGASCSDTTVPAGTITELRVVLSKSGHLTGPIGPELTRGTKAVQYKYACPAGQRRRPEIPVNLGGAKPAPTLQTPR